MATVAATEVRTRTTSLRTWSIALRATEMVVGGVLFILLLEYILGFNLLDAQLWKEYAAPFQDGILGTLALVAVADSRSSLDARYAFGRSRSWAPPRAAGGPAAG